MKAIARYNGDAAIRVGGRLLEATEVFDTYWKFARDRQAIYEARVRGESAPWTSDPILRTYRFTNCYRAADRVSQFLLRRVAYSGPQDLRNIVFRILLFKMFNTISTWRLLERHCGEISWESFDLDDYDAILSETIEGGCRLYSAAYIMPPPGLGAVRKHTNHLRLVQHMIQDGVHQRLSEAKSMRDAFRVLLDYPSIGNFIAYQLLIDINYSTALDFNENDFVVAGPGAKDGIRKCFGHNANGIEADVIRFVAETQSYQFYDRGLEFNGLRGRPLHLIDCQNLFCEVDKYARVAHPDVLGISGRVRIKQKFQRQAHHPTPWFPPKWGINDAVPVPDTRQVRRSDRIIGQAGTTTGGVELG